MKLFKKILSAVLSFGMLFSTVCAVVPTNLDECCAELDKILSQEEKDKIKNSPVEGMLCSYLRSLCVKPIIAERRMARRYGYGFGQTLVYWPGQHSRIYTVHLFDSEEPLRIEADEIYRMAEPIDFLDTKVIGFIKDWGCAVRHPDKDTWEKLVCGILTENLDMVKSAVESAKSPIDMFPVVTSDETQVDFDPFLEARYCKNKEIADYLKKVKDEQMKFYFVPRPVSPASPVSFGGFIPSIPGK